MRIVIFGNVLVPQMYGTTCKYHWDMSWMFFTMCGIRKLRECGLEPWGFKGLGLRNGRVKKVWRFRSCRVSCVSQGELCHPRSPVTYILGSCP